MLSGDAGALVEKLWATKLPSEFQSWPGVQNDQALPEIPLLIKVYGAAAEVATVTQMTNHYSRCERPFVDAFPAANLPEHKLRDSSSGFQE